MKERHHTSPDGIPTHVPTRPGRLYEVEPRLTVTRSLGEVILFQTGNHVMVGHAGRLMLPALPEVMSDFVRNKWPVLAVIEDGHEELYIYAGDLAKLDPAFEPYLKRIAAKLKLTL